MKAEMVLRGYQVEMGREETDDAFKTSGRFKNERLPEREHHFGICRHCELQI